MFREKSDIRLNEEKSDSLCRKLLSVRFPRIS